MSLKHRDKRNGELGTAHKPLKEEDQGNELKTDLFAQNSFVASAE